VVHRLGFARLLGGSQTYKTRRKLPFGDWGRRASFCTTRRIEDYDSSIRSECHQPLGELVV